MIISKIVSTRVLGKDIIRQQEEIIEIHFRANT